MKKNNSLSIKEGLSFIVTIKSENIGVLREASKKYQVEIPDAKYIIIYTDEQIDYYYELEDGSLTESAFSILTDSPMDKNDALMILICNIDAMSWDKILEDYLAQLGIDYEE